MPLTIIPPEAHGDPEKIRRASQIPAGLYPTREAFFEEVLFPQGTARTPRFDDYTPGSYHVDPDDVLKGMPEAAAGQCRKLVGLLVLGPLGPLWQYRVIAFLERADRVQVNQVVMPHARISYKSSGHLSLVEYQDLIGRLSAHPLVRTGEPTGRRTNVLLADWSSGTVKEYRGLIQEFGGDRQATEGFLEPINQVLKLLTTTYSHLPE